MQFMIMHKMTAELEKGGPPDPEIMAAVGTLVDEAAKQGALVAGEGLKPSSERTHILYRDGKRTITDGPFAEAKELVAGFGLFRVKSKEEAISWCDRFAEVLGDVELYMGPVVEPWDLGFGSRPDDAPLRFLSMHEWDERAASAPPNPALFEKMGALIDEMTKAGVLEATGGLTSPKEGTRVHFKGGKHTVMDGPFAESKELVAGFVIMDLPSKAAAIEWAIRFGQIVKVDEVEVRPMA